MPPSAPRYHKNVFLNVWLFVKRNSLILCFVFETDSSSYVCHPQMENSKKNKNIQLRENSQMRARETWNNQMFRHFFHQMDRTSSRQRLRCHGFQHQSNHKRSITSGFTFPNQCDLKLIIQVLSGSSPISACAAATALTITGLTKLAVTSTRKLEDCPFFSFFFSSDCNSGRRSALLLRLLFRRAQCLSRGGGKQKVMAKWWTVWILGGGSNPVHVVTVQLL